MHVSVKRFAEWFEGKHTLNYESFDNEGAYYCYGVFYVDSTAIACVGTDVNKEDVLILSADGLSPKITPYLPELEGMLKVLPQNVYKIPQARAKSSLYHTFNDVGINAIFADRLGKLQEDMKVNGRTVYKCQEYFKWFTIYEKLRHKVKPSLEKMTDWMNEANECLNHLEEVSERVTDFMNNHSYKELVDIAFFKGECDCMDIDENFRALLRSAMNSAGDLAFLKVFDDGNTYSPDLDADGNYRMVMTNEDSLNLTNALLDGTLKHGMKFGNFTIMSKRHGYVKISCNKYSPEMLKVIHDDCIKHNEEKGV